MENSAAIGRRGFTRVVKMFTHEKVGRQAYMDALEEASVRRNIIPFTKFVAEEMSVDWSPELAEAERFKG